MAMATLVPEAQELPQSQAVTFEAILGPIYILLQFTPNIETQLFHHSSRMFADAAPILSSTRYQDIFETMKLHC